MRLPIDTSAITFMVTGPAEPVTDFDTKAPKLDDAGAPLFALQLVALGESGAEIISVKVAGQPAALTAGTSVKVSGLFATPWAMGDRSGVAFKAAKVEPATTPGATTAARPQ